MSSETKRPRMADRRRRYETPSVVSDEVFETLALACGKDSINIGGCVPPQS